MEGALQVSSMLVFAAIMLVAAASLGFVVYADRKARVGRNAIPDEQRGKYPQGRWMGIGLGLGMLMGLPLGLALQNLAVGPALGLCLGVAVGRSLEERHKAETRPLTSVEERVRSRTMVVSLILLALVVIGTAVLLYAMPK
jgi:hypothetical protein